MPTFIRDEQLELIRRAMETLSEKDREIARSYYLDGASYDELIETHGLSYKAISFRLSRAKQRLTKRLQHLLTGLSVPSTTILKQIYSGGLIVMKIGTVPKIAVTAIGIVALIFRRDADDELQVLYNRSHLTDKRGLKQGTSFLESLYPCSALVLTHSGILGTNPRHKSIRTG